MQCHGKKRYEDAASAKKAANDYRYRRLKGFPVRVNHYSCAICGGWHWGHTPGQNPKRKRSRGR